MRFYKPGNTQYQSQFAPLNLDFMQKNLAQREQNDLIANDALDKADQLTVEGGMLSDKNEVNQYNEWLKSNIQKTRDGLATGELSPAEAARNISKIQSMYNSSDAIKFFNADKKLSDQTRLAISQGKLDGGISSHISYLDKQLKPTTMSYKEGLDALANAYNMTTPTGMYDKENYAAQFADLKPSIKGTSWETNSSVKEIAPGVMAVMNSDGKTVNTALTRQMVRDIGLKMAPLELQNSNTPWVKYQKQFYGREGVDYTPEQFATDFENSYTGYINNVVSENNKKYNVISSGKENSSKKPARIPARPTSQPEKNIGFKKSNFFRTTQVGGGYTGGTVMGTASSTKVEPKQIKELPENMKNVAIDFAKNNPKWGKIAKNPNGKYTDLDKFYEDLDKSGILKLHEEAQIKSQSTMTYINSDSEDWGGLFGGTKGARTLVGLTNTPLDTDWYDLESGKKMSLTSLIENAEEGGKTVINGIGEYSAENNMNIFLPRNLDGTRPVSIKVDGKEYIAQSPYPTTTEDRHIKQIYDVIFETKTENLQKGTPIDFTIPADGQEYNINGFRYKYDREKENFKLLDDNGNPIKTLSKGGQEKELDFPNATELYNYLITNFIQ